MKISGELLLKVADTIYGLRTPDRQIHL